MHASLFWPLQVDDMIFYVESTKQQQEQQQQLSGDGVADSGSTSSSGLPTFIGGHSMGGLVACLVALRAQDMWAGLLLHSAAIDVEWTPILRYSRAAEGSKGRWGSEGVHFRTCCRS